ncbi:hypothetical protein FRB94_008681 [Tulasnella sp. JGI-2019a]|nr:hypothetical protein FRB94_008681 [Tulasnella sp. JGI-2019a]
MALLFVTEKSGDVAAVTASVTPTDLNFMVMTVAKNSDRNAPSKEPNAVTESTTSRTSDWLQDRLVSGPFDVKTHAGYLADLISKLHNAQGEKLAETVELSQYVYCQCLLKISKRVKAEIARGISAIKFFDLLDPAGIKFSDDPFPPPKGSQQLAERGRLAAQDESWLIDLLQDHWEIDFQGKDDKVDGVPVKHLVLNKKAKQLLAGLIASTVERLDEQVSDTILALSRSKAIDKKTGVSIERIDKIKDCLGDLTDTMDDIDSFVHRSVAVWDLLHSIEMRQFFKSLRPHLTTETETGDAPAEDPPLAPGEVTITPAPENATEATVTPAPKETAATPASEEATETPAAEEAAATTALEKVAVTQEALVTPALEEVAVTPVPVEATVTPAAGEATVTPAREEPEDVTMTPAPEEVIMTPAPEEAAAVPAPEEVAVKQEAPATYMPEVAVTLTPEEVTVTLAPEMVAVTPAPDKAAVTPASEEVTAIPALEEAAVEDDEEEDNIPELEPGPPPGPELRHWMKCLALYPRALHSLRAHIKVFCGQLFHIRVVETSLPSQPSQQASLQMTLSAVSDGSLEDVARCRDLIKQAVLRGPERSVRDKAYQCLIGKLDDTEWEGSFRGNVHCEACLACEMIMAPIAHQNSIGTSKRCCAICTWFLEAVDPEIRYSATHGKVYPWALPTIDIDPKIKSAAAQDILEKLVHHLRTSLAEEDAQRGSHTPDSASGSDGTHRRMRAAKKKPTKRKRDLGLMKALEEPVS